MTYTIVDRREFNGREYLAATNGGGACVYLPTDGRLDCVADSKTGRVLAVPAGGLVAYAKASR